MHVIACDGCRAIDAVDKFFVCQDQQQNGDTLRPDLPREFVHSALAGFRIFRLTPTSNGNSGGDSALCKDCTTKFIAERCKELKLELT